MTPIRYCGRIVIFFSLIINGVQGYKKDTAASWTCAAALFPVPLYQKTSPDYRATSE
jgi:hypothetical protein